MKTLNQKKIIMETKMNNIIQQHTKQLQILLSNTQFTFDTNLSQNLPSEAGVYRIFEPASDPSESVYVGTSGNLKKRVSDDLLTGDSQTHTLRGKLIQSLQLDDKGIIEYLKNRCKVQVVVMTGEKERFLFEHFAISVLKPKYND
jgi:excinuclease UvrABC nuclease subunit